MQQQKQHAAQQGVRGRATAADAGEAEGAVGRSQARGCRRAAEARGQRRGRGARHARDTTMRDRDSCMESMRRELEEPANRGLTFDIPARSRRAGYEAPEFMAVQMTGMGVDETDHNLLKRAVRQMEREAEIDPDKTAGSTLWMTGTAMPTRERAAAEMLQYKGKKHDEVMWQLLNHGKCERV